MTFFSTDHYSADNLPVPDMSVDACGLNCPLPILRAKKALATMQSGQVLRVTATDPGSKQDFSAFCEQTGNALLARVDLGNEVAFFIRRR